MKTRFKIVLFMVIAPLMACAQVNGDYLRLNNRVLEGLEIKDERTFTKESLFGYMNGGAELYLEYGFNKLLVTDINYKGHELKAEVFRMENPGSAFGIFSVNIFRCDDSDRLARFYCQSDYQVQFCRADYYVNVINTSGSSEGLSAARQIAQYFIDRINGDDFSVEPYLPEGMDIDDVSGLKLIKGAVSADNNAYEYTEFVKGLNDFTLLVAETSDKVLLVISSKESEWPESFFYKRGFDTVPSVGEAIELDKYSYLILAPDRIVVYIDQL